MPRVATIKQYQTLTHIRGQLTGILTRLDKIHCHGLLHEEQTLMIAVYIALEKERNAIHALLEEYPRRTSARRDRLAIIAA